jgi:hypothetical protein
MGLDFAALEVHDTNWKRSRGVKFWTVSSSVQRLCYPYNETMRRMQNTVNLYTDICSRCTKYWNVRQQQYLRVYTESDRIMPITTTLIPGVSCACVDATQRSVLNRPYGSTKVFQPFYIHNVDDGNHTIIVTGEKALWAS